MLNDTRRSLQSAGGLTKRSLGSNQKKAKNYSKIDQNDQDELEMKNLGESNEDSGNIIGASVMKPG